MLYGEQTNKCVQTMSFSGKTLGDYPVYVRTLLKVKAATATANTAIGTMDAPTCQAIVRACNDLIATYDRCHYPVDVFHGGGGIGINMNINEVISACAMQKQGVRIHPITDVNRSQSTADVCHTAIRLTLHTLLTRLLDTLQSCLAVFEDKQKAFDGIATIARTCLMDAMEMNVGDRFSGYVSVLQRRMARAEQIQAACLQVNLGGTVIGSGDGAPTAYKAAALVALQKIFGPAVRHTENLFDAAQNLDELVEVAQTTSNMAQVLLKISRDFRFLASGPEAGIGELTLPKTQAGSTFFPGKVNPVLPEMMMQCAFYVMGLAHSVEACLTHGDTDLNVFEEFAAVLVMDQITALTNAVEQFTRHALVGIEVNRDTCEAHANSLIPTITRFANKHGYTAATNALTEARDKGVPIKNYLSSLGF